MDGPEQLEAGGAPVRRRTWVVLVAVVAALVAVLGLVRLDRQQDETDPYPYPDVTPSAASTAWPRGMGFGTLLLLDDAGMVQVDLGSGLAHRSEVRATATTDTMTSAWLGALVWRHDGSQVPLFVGVGDGLSAEVTGASRSGREFVAGPEDSLWVGSPDRGSRWTWRLVDGAGAVSTPAELEGSVVGDGSGGLFGIVDHHVTHLGADRRRTTFDGRVVATGPDGYEVVRCVGSRCSTLLHERAGGREKTLVTVTPGDRVAALAPGNRRVATLVAVRQADGSPAVVQVSEPGSAGSMRLIAGTDEQSTMTWVSERWLVVTTRTGLVLYDAIDDVLVRPDLTLTNPAQPIYQPA